MCATATATIAAIAIDTDTIAPCVLGFDFVSAYEHFLWLLNKLNRGLPYRAVAKTRNDCEFCCHTLVETLRLMFYRDGLECFHWSRCRE